jgi:hypothetical protein
MKEQIQKLRAANGVIYPNTIKRLASAFIESIKQQNPNLKSDNVFEHCYWILNDLEDYPKKCLVCNSNITSFRSINERYKVDLCSASCKQKYYFIQHPDKRKKEKPKASKEDSMQKRIETSRARFGTDFPWQSEEVKKKMKDIFISKYGVDNPYAAGKIKEKIKETLNERYGVDFITQSENVKEKIKETNLNRFGERSYLSTQKCREVLNELLKQKVLERTQKLGYSLLSENWNGVGEIHLWKHDACGNEFEGNADDGKMTRCPHCFPKIGSYEQQEVVDYIKSIYNGEVIVNSRQIIAPKEIDIYLPELKLGFEYHGIYWHSTDGVPSNEFKNYHLNKMFLCEEQGIRLIQIFSDEWTFKQNIIKSKILNLIGKSKRIFARKCKVVELCPKDKSEFLIETHLQGDDKSSIRLGLKYEDDLVAVMTFGKSRFSAKYEYELVRFASKNGINVIGGAGKLLSYFINTFNPTSIVTYADLRYSQGNLYKQLGFTKLHRSSPNYFYFKLSEGVRYNRMRFQKHKLPKQLETFNESLSEMQNMFNNGYRVIYDCGNFVYEMKVN